MGRYTYSAPELAITVEAETIIGHAVDIWSCGVILHAMLVGKLPFDDGVDSNDKNALYNHISSSQINPPSFISDEARDLLSVMLVVDPEQRAHIDTVKAHQWLKPWAHLFNLTVQDLERSAISKHKRVRSAKDIV